MRWRYGHGRDKGGTVNNYLVQSMSLNLRKNIKRETTHPKAIRTLERSDPEWEPKCIATS